jgi:hypothetical protein
MTEQKHPVGSKQPKVTMNGENINEEISEKTHSKALELLTTKINDIAQQLERVQIADYVDLINSPRKVIQSNILAGISRGIGFTIGVTVFTAVIVYLLQQLGALNLPIVGNFITEIVKYVQFQLDSGPRHF